MRLFACAILCVMLGSCLAGCAITLNDEGKAGLYYSSTIEFGVLHKSQRTDGQSRSTLDMQPLVDYIVELNSDDGPRVVKKNLTTGSKAVEPIVPPKTRPIMPGSDAVETP